MCVCAGGRQPTGTVSPVMAPNGCFFPCIMRGMKSEISDQFQRVSFVWVAPTEGKVFFIYPTCFVSTPASSVQRGQHKEDINLGGTYTTRTKMMILLMVLRTCNCGLFEASLARRPCLVFLSVLIRAKDITIIPTTKKL